MNVVSPFTAAGYLSTRLAGLQAAAAESAYDGQLAKWHRMIFDHQLNVEELASNFRPLAITSLGVCDKRSLLWMRQFSDVCPAALSIDKGTAFSNLLAPLSLAL